MARLKEKYQNEIVPELIKEFSYSNKMEVPKVKKVTVNMGIGEAKTDAKAIDGAVKDLTAITGQKPLITRARRSIAGFKLREGMIVGAMVTLRGERMYEFLDRLLSLALPRVRDFKGLPEKLDGQGNYTLGLTEQLVFPEVDYDSVDKTRGMNITVVTSADTDEQAKALLVHMGFPFRKD
jgi:large subunit ribosomal protein L5